MTIITGATMALTITALIGGLILTIMFIPAIMEVDIMGEGIAFQINAVQIIPTLIITDVLMGTFTTMGQGRWGLTGMAE